MLPRLVSQLASFLHACTYFERRRRRTLSCTPAHLACDTVQMKYQRGQRPNQQYSQNHISEDSGKIVDCQTHSVPWQ